LNEHPALTLPPPPAASVWVGFSGGLDSTVLLHALHTQAQAGGFAVRAVHIHHGLSTQADAWAAHTERLCADWGVPYRCLKVHVNDRERNVEAQARDARYAAFDSVYSEGDCLALAHHADDVAETLLLRLMRGAGTEGLGNMREHRQHGRMQVWRPLLQYPRETLLAYARAHGLQWLDDDSNLHTGFDRNFLRHEVLPLLQQRFPQAGQRLALSASLLRADADIIQGETERHLAACQRGPGLALEALLALPPVWQAHTVRLWLRRAGRETPGHAALLDLLAKLHGQRADAGSPWCGPDTAVGVWQQGLYWYPRQKTVPVADWSAHWNGDAPLALPRGGQLAWQGPAPFAAVVRYRTGSERLQLPGRSMHHSVKKLLSERVPPWQRDALPFVYNESGELLAVANVLYSHTLDLYFRQHGNGLIWHAPESPP